MAQQDLRLKDLEQIKEVFETLGVRFFVVYGALLGIHRDGKLIDHDDDIDLAVIDPIDLETRKKLGWMLYDLGFETQPIAFNVFGRMEPAYLGYNGDAETGIIVCQRNFKFTIFFFKEESCAQHGQEYVCTPMLGAMKLIATPTKFFEKSATIKVGGKKYLAPAPIEEYLDFTYFNNWRDSTDRRHGETYQVMHAVESITKDEANNVAIFHEGPRSA